MKIGIVTLPLHFNYGGILQAFALQEVIKRCGYEPVLIYTKTSNIKEFIKRILYNRSNVYKFIKKNIDYKYIDNLYSYHELISNDIYTLIVGSDQVWRPCMGFNRLENVNKYFLKTDFNGKIKKISYAASFGVDYWDFTSEETNIAKNLITDFASISVRELSGIELCRKYLNVTDVVHVLDPTLLLTKEFYIKYLGKSPYVQNKIHCFLYLLDYYSSQNKKIVHGLLPIDSEIVYFKVEHNPIKKYLNRNNTVEKWLSSIYFSDLVITDSFHGCVFSIIFHKNFYVLGNTKGGNSRINSLLSSLGLEDRFVENLNELNKSNIKWDAVEYKLKQMKNKSISFIQKSLTI